MPKLLASAALAAVLAAGAAQADVTPREVWNDWIAAIEGGDATLSTDAIDEGRGTLTVTGLTMSSEIDDGGYTVRIDRVEFAQEDDGTVSVTMSPEYRVTLTNEAEAATSETVLRVSHPGLVMTVSGDEAERRHAYEAPELTVTVESATEVGEPIDLAAVVRLTEAAGHYDVREGDAASYDSRLSAAAMTAAVAGTDPDEGETFDFDLQMQDIVADNFTSFLGGDMAAIAARLRDGFSTEGALRYGELTYTLETESDDQTVNLRGGAESGEISAILSEDGLRYGGSNTGTTLVISGSTIPLPEVSLTMAESEIEFAMPVLAGEAAQDYDVTLRLVDVAVDEALWSMIDPAGVLPRDPASLVIDLSGQATLEEDMLTGDDDGAPGQVESLAIEEMRLSLAGAELTATGDLTFAQDAAPMPQPEGEIELRLVGGNALIDRLVQMGLVPQDQAMNARMMVGLFARPGDGADELVSTIRFVEDGGVLVNDQRVR